MVSGDNANNNIALEHYGTTAGGSLRLYRARNTAAAPQTVIDTEDLQGLRWIPFDGNSWEQTASITALVNGHRRR